MEGGKEVEGAKFTISSFVDLESWKKSHVLVVEIYKVTCDFPSEEKFGLTSQMRRAAVSVTSNIAEGFGRQTYKEKVQFYYVASGSLTELKNQLLIARDIGYLEKEKFDRLSERANQAHKILNGLIKKSKSFCVS